MPWKFYKHNITRAKHLLDLYWKWCMPFSSNTQTGITINPPNQLGHSPKCCLLFPFCKKGTDSENHGNEGVRATWVKIHLRSNARKRIKNAYELYKMAGVTFQKREHENGFGVTFRNGILELPHLQLDPNQTILLANLVAYEEFKPSRKRVMTSYVLLLDGLINTEKDVELLQRHGVITNKLENSQTASAYFNDIGNICSVDYSDRYCQKQFDNLNTYYNSKWNRHWAKLRHEYFTSPWSAISVLAGATLLALAIVQTIYSVKRYEHHH
jgi:Plant protein of unknown function